MPQTPASGVENGVGAGEGVCGVIQGAESESESCGKKVSS